MNIREYISFILFNTQLLGIYGGFYFIGIPFLILILFAEYKDQEEQEIYKEELLGRLPTQEIQLNLNEEEKEMLEVLIKRNNYTSMDKYLRACIKELIECEF